MKPEQGLVFNIERFAIHDGPGIRTLVFMKGCPLRCLWCSSPQSQKPFPEITYDPDACKRCGTCTQTCPTKAIAISLENGVKIDTQLCNLCGECVTVCPNKALELVGRYYTAESLFREIAKDQAFFRRSQGGVTVGGGEPTMQSHFLMEFLRICKSQYSHTAIETCGYCRGEQLDLITEYCDLVFMDIKHMDNIIHQKLTGVSNEIILKNARETAIKRPLIIRIPVVPGCNDSVENIRAIAEFASKLGGKFLRVDLLPYHKLGIGNYRRLGMKYQLHDLESPTVEKMEQLRAVVEDYGINTQIE